MDVVEPILVRDRLDDVGALFAKYALPIDLGGITEQEYAALDTKFNSMKGSNITLTADILNYLQVSIKNLRGEFAELTQIT